MNNFPRQYNVLTSASCHPPANAMPSPEAKVANAWRRAKAPSETTTRSVWASDARREASAPLELTRASKNATSWRSAADSDADWGEGKGGS